MIYSMDKFGNNRQEARFHDSIVKVLEIGSKAWATVDPSLYR